LREEKLERMMKERAFFLLTRKTLTTATKLFRKNTIEGNRKSKSLLVF